MLLIGAFAALGGVTAKTLRHYDERGIFGPAWLDPETGYRYYSPAQLPELRRILALRDLGVPLREVAGLLADGADLGPALLRRRRELEESRQRIDRDLRALDIWVDSVDSGPEVVLRSVEAQLVAGLTATVAPGEDVAPLFYELEAVVRETGSRAPLPPGLLTPRRQPGGGRRVEVFVPIRRPVSAGRVASRRLPASRVAAVIHRGPYDGMPAARSALERWAGEAGYEPADEIRILFLRFGAEPELELPTAYLAERSADFVTEIQLPLAER